MEQRRSSPWIAILCLSLLLHQFSPGFATWTFNDDGNAVEDEPFANKFTDDIYGQDDLQDETKDVAAGKRNLLSTLAKYAFKALDFGLKYGDELAALVDLSVNLPVAVGGCNTYYSSIKENWKKVQKLNIQFENISSEIDCLSLEAKQTQEYADSSIRQYESTRRQLETIAKNLRLVFETMSPKFMRAMRTSTAYIEEIVKEKNSTKEKIDAMQVVEMYDVRLDAVFNVLVSSLTLAMPAFKQLYRYVKGSAIGYKIIKMEDKLKVKFEIKGSAYDYQELEGTRFMSVDEAKIKSNVNDMTNNAATKYKSGHGFYSKVKKGIGNLFSLGSMALSFWGVYDTISTCETIRDKAKESADNMKYFVNNATEYLADIKIAHQTGQEAWQQIVDVAWNDTLIFALRKVEDMMSHPAFTKDIELSTTVLRAIKNYIDATKRTITPSETNRIQRELAAALYTVPFPLKCHANEVRVFDLITKDCLLGTDTFEEVYKTAAELVKPDSDMYECKKRVGEGYINLERLKEAWKDSIKGNDTVKERCLLNSPVLLDTVRSALENGVTDAEIIANRALKPHWKDDIEELLRTLPKPVPKENDLSLRDKRKTCYYDKGRDKADTSDEEFVEEIKSLVPNLTLELYRDLDCSQFE